MTGLSCLTIPKNLQSKQKGGPEWEFSPYFNQESQVVCLPLSVWPIRDYSTLSQTGQSGKNPKSKIICVMGRCNNVEIYWKRNISLFSKMWLLPVFAQRCHHQSVTIVNALWTISDLMKTLSCENDTTWYLMPCLCNMAQYSIYIAS